MFSIQLEMKTKTNIQRSKEIVILHDFFFSRNFIVFLKPFHK